MKEFTVTETKDNQKWVRDKYAELALAAKDYLPEAF